MAASRKFGKSSASKSIPTKQIDVGPAGSTAKIDFALSQIKKQFGEGSIMRLGDGAPQAEISVIYSCK